ncbi:MAG TPA: hypothetical protein VKB62_01550 [Streptosporangiaceae bacterium]|nr:hypothetical protein [Streptosporangiaceae bacterium]
MGCGRAAAPLDGQQPIPPGSARAAMFAVENRPDLAGDVMAALKRRGTADGPG